MKKLFFSCFGLAAIFATILVFITVGSIFANAQSSNDKQPVLPLPSAGEPRLGGLLAPTNLSLLLDAEGDLVVSVDPISALLQLKVDLSTDGGQSYVLAGAAQTGVNSFEIQEVVCGTTYTVRASLLDTLLNLLSLSTAPKSISVRMCDAPIIDVDLDTQDDIVVQVNALDDTLRLDAEISTDGLNFLPVLDGDPTDNIVRVIDPVCGATYTIRARLTNLISQLLSDFSQPQPLTVICSDNGVNPTATLTPGGGGNGTATSTPVGGGNATAISTPNGGGSSPTATSTSNGGSQPPQALQGFRILGSNASSLTLGWNAVTQSGLQIFIERSLNAGANWSVVAMLPGASTSFVDTNLGEGVSYSYRGYTYDPATGAISAYTPTLWHDGGTINLLVNGSFETDVNGDRIPDGWKDKRLENDKVVTNKAGSSAKSMKMHAYDGNNAFRFKAPADQKEKLIQQVLNINGQPGDSLTLQLMAKAKNLAPHAQVHAKLIVYRPDGTRSKLNVRLPNDSYEYTSAISTTYVSDHAFSDARVVINFKSPTGKWWVDHLRLTYDAAQ